MAVKMPNKIIFTVAFTASLVLTAGALFYCLVISDVCSINTFVFSADQQGQRLFRQGKYAEAAERFTSLDWRAASHFRGGDFKQAASLYSGMSSAEGTFNQGNTLVMLGKYEDAIKVYDRVLSQKPEWEDARINRQIAIARAEMVKKEGGNMTAGKLGADDFVFDNSKSDAQQNEQNEEVQAAGEAEMQAMWLRRVQTRPADFLRAKFAYQHAMKSGK